MSDQQQPSPWNVPNALTVFRILLVPVFLWLLLAADGLDPVMRLWAFGVFALAMITDAVDGDLARRYNLITDFGKIADPIADKALLGAALIGLALVRQLPWWVPVVILARELLITLIRFAVIRYGVMPASKGGKLKTVLQTGAIGLFLLLLPLQAVLDHGVMLVITVVSWAVLVAAIVVTVVTGVDYIIKAVRLVREGTRSGERVSRSGAAEVLELLRARGLTLATAESLTAGAISSQLAGVPGASAVLRGGVVCYATEVKAAVLGVDPALLEAEGPVHPEVARQLAHGARTLLAADVAVSATGVAGPDPQGGAPVGRVHLGLALPGELLLVRSLDLDGDRAAIRAATVDAALELIAAGLGAES